MVAGSSPARLTNTLRDLVERTAAGETSRATAPRFSQLRRRSEQLIVEEAQTYVFPSPTSHDFLDQNGVNQCNRFVQIVLENAGTVPPLAAVSIIEQAIAKSRIGQYLGYSAGPSYPASAGDWAFPRTTMKCWMNVPTKFNDSLAGGPTLDPADRAEPGDVIAETIFRYSDASGHVGIVQAQQQTISADSAIDCADAASGLPVQPAGTIDVSDYGFRPDNWVDPLKDPRSGQPCRLYGKNSSAVVKRFVCK